MTSLKKHSKKRKDKLKIKTKVNKTPLFFGLLLTVVGDLVRYSIREIDMNSISPFEAYQHALAGQFWSGVGMLGWFICIIWGIVFLVRNKWPQYECKACGAQIKRKDDLFCRECGAELSTDGVNR